MVRGRKSVQSVSKNNTLTDDQQMAIFSAKQEEWLYRPDLFVTEALGWDLSKQQIELFQIVGKLTAAKIAKRTYGEENLPPEVRELSNKRGISVRSGKGTGKDFSAAALILWMECMQASNQFNTKVATMAPTKDALKTVLWSEVSKLYSAMNSKGESRMLPYYKDQLVLEAERIYNKSVEKGKDNCQCFQRTVKRSANGTDTTTALGGIHADNLLCILDEATAIPDEVFEGLISTLTDDNNWSLLIFNPTTTSGYAARTHLDDELQKHWITLHWDARDCERLSKDYIESMRHKYGEGSNQWKAFVTGEFPIDNDGALVNMQWVYDARDNIEPFVHHREKWIAGVDIGGGGADPTVICLRRGPKVYQYHRIFRDEPDDIAEDIARFLWEHGVDEIYYDADGAGTYIGSLLRQKFKHVVGIKGSERAYHHDKFKRRRDELLWVVRERFMKREISIPRNDMLLEELLAISFDEGLLDGKIKVEGKDALRKRLGRSIDYVDATALAFYGSDHQGSLRTQKEHDAYDDDGWIEEQVSEFGWMGA